MSTPNWIMVTVKTPQTAGDSYMATIMKNHLERTELFLPFRRTICCSLAGLPTGITTAV